MMTAVRDNGYALRVPLGKDQWVNLVSNKPMTRESFARLRKYFALQEQMFDEDAKAIELRSGQPERLDRSGECAMAESHFPGTPKG
jgi:hypothetical protein